MYQDEEIRDVLKATIGGVVEACELLAEDEYLNRISPALAKISARLVEDLTKQGFSREEAMTLASQALNRSAAK